MTPAFDSIQGSTWVNTNQPSCFFNRSCWHFQQMDGTQFETLASYHILSYHISSIISTETVRELLQRIQPCLKQAIIAAPPRRCNEVHRWSCGHLVDANRPSPCRFIMSWAKTSLFEVHAPYEPYEPNLVVSTIAERCWKMLKVNRKRGF